MAGAFTPRKHSIQTPNVFGPPQGITQTRFYRAEVRLPEARFGAKGRPTPANLPGQLAAAGTLMQYVGPTGNPAYYVNMRARPQER